LGVKGGGGPLIRSRSRDINKAEGVGIVDQSLRKAGQEGDGKRSSGMLMNKDQNQL
jgi:hypothetical protein